MRPHTDTAQLETAESINHHNPLWLVIWGVASRRYWAFRAPRGASLYPRLSREELGGRFLGLMAYPAPKG